VKWIRYDEAESFIEEAFRQALPKFGLHGLAKYEHNPLKSIESVGSE
jgi:hypothetical protein